MARPKDSDKYFYFDAYRFNKDVQDAVKKATREVGQLVEATTKQSLDNIPFKSNVVPLADGTRTSDAARKADLRRSIMLRNLGWQEAHLTDSLLQLPYKYGAEKSGFASEVTAMQSGDYKNTHVGVYYEYGTGAKEDSAAMNALGISVGDENPYRTPRSGLPVVTRPTSEWQDTGGNVRRSKGKGGVTRAQSPLFNKSIGEDIQAYYWFRDAYQKVNGDGTGVHKIYMKHLGPILEALKDNRTYLVVQKQIVLGRRR